jgi:hypothetical protein
MPQLLNSVIKLALNTMLCGVPILFALHWYDDIDWNIG